MARSIDCRCTYNFTCGHCLANAKPYHFTLSDGSRSYQLPAFLSQPGAVKLAKLRSDDSK